MAEREFPMQPVGVEYVCDKCGEGLMEPHGSAAWLTDPIQFPHRCNKCGHELAFTERYPALRWKRTNGVKAWPDGAAFTDMQGGYYDERAEPIVGVHPSSNDQSKGSK